MSREFQGTARELAAARAQFSSDVAEAMVEHGENELPEEEVEALRRKKEATKRFFEAGKDIVASFKIEVQFGRGRSKKESFPGSLHLYRSGSVLAGGGDEIVYQCPDNKCPGVILPEHMGGLHAVCPTCQRRFNREKDLADTRLFRLSYENWAEVIYKMFMRLGGDADIYLKTHGNDIRSASLQEQLRERQGEVYLGARTRVAVMYSLENIMKDKHAGADLLHRFRAFVVA